MCNEQVVQWAYMLAGKELGRWNFYIFGYSYIFTEVVEN